MNEQNLIPNSERSPSEVRANGKKGGIASGKVRREKKHAKEVARAILDEIVHTENGSEVDVRYAMLKNIARKATSGDVRAMLAIIKVADEMPSEKHEFTGDLVLNITTTDKGAKAMQKLNELGDEQDI